MMPTACSPEGRVRRRLSRVLLLACLGLACIASSWATRLPGQGAQLSWRSLPDVPSPVEVAGCFAGACGEVFILAGGRESERVAKPARGAWRDSIYVLRRRASSDAWVDAGRLPHGAAYGASVSVEAALLCIGGRGADGEGSREVLRLRFDGRAVQSESLPPLPRACEAPRAARVGQVVYVADAEELWSLDLEAKRTALTWRAHAKWAGSPSDAFAFVAQHNGYDACLYRIGTSGETHEYNTRTRRWRRRASAPQGARVLTAAAFGQAHVYAFGAPGSREVLAYHTITDTWTKAVSTDGAARPAVRKAIPPLFVLEEGSVDARPTRVWSVTPVSSARAFGTTNYVVLTLYLLAVLAIGFFFARRNSNTDDYFRGGKRIPWWAAGCSIFATMLSSLTYTGIPSKAFAQDWVYAVGNFLIPVVAFVAIYIALPFYRRLDVTSAYEYLERRFHRGLRLFGSASFALFHVFRIAVVLSLTGLALAVATPLSPAQSVLIMGALSIAYCTMGGIEAVIWTDTLQALVLLGGAILALLALVAGTGSELGEIVAMAREGEKFRIANFHLSASSAQVAFWVIVLGGVGQNLSSYCADQAVVQRYMTTKDSAQAARSIWTNAVVSVFATLLFFAIGTALWVFYRLHPERLDPTIGADQVFPLFLAFEMPLGLAGLIVAGVFAAAQSTVSTSMNSTATTVVTDFLRPYGACRSEAASMRAARIVTFLVGAAGTGIGLVFVDPDIKSLFDEFLKVLGLFMGVLGGLFLLGVGTKRANTFGASVGAIFGAAAMLALWLYTPVQAYLYTSCGIANCVVIGYVASRLYGRPKDDLQGLTLHTLRGATNPSTSRSRATRDQSARE